MKYLFCGTLVPEEYENRIQGISNAANRFLLNFCKELSKANEIQFFSYIGVDVEKSIKTELCECSPYHHYFKSQNIISGIRRYYKGVKEQVVKSDCMIAYNAIYAWLFVPFLAKRYKKKSVLILADFTAEESFRSIARRIYAKIQLQTIQRYEYVIGLSKASNRFLKPSQKFMCLEGGIDQKVYDFFAEEHELTKQENEIIFMYAGLLDAVTGIQMLIRAFSNVPNPLFQLVISGKGDLEDEIKRATEKDSRITYLGCVAYEEYLNNLRKATVLVNPRDMNLFENQNNFPSKILEYLATGKTIISTRFPGWEKYDDYIMFCDSNEKALQETILRAEPFEHDRKKTRLFASQFLWDSQIKKLENWLNENND